MNISVFNENSDNNPATAASLRNMLIGNDKPRGDGVFSARERITSLFDQGTFTEIGAYTMRRITEFDASSPDEFESVICGYGSVDGYLVYAFCQDFSRTKGSVSEASAKKICRTYTLAIENGCPIVGIFDSAGAYLPEGIRALAGYGRIMKAISSASGIIPQIALVPGIAQGAAAIAVSMFDFVVATEKSEISVNPPFVVGGGKTQDSIESGIVTVAKKTDADAISAVRELLRYLPSNNEEGSATIETSDRKNRITDIAEYKRTGNMRSFISAIADDNKYYELGTGFENSMFSGFISLGGTVCGVVATDYSTNEGRLTSKGAREASRFINFCDCFGIPVITLVDSEGFEIAGAEEKNPYCAEIGRLAESYASARIPLVTLITGNAYGSVFSIMGSRSIGADLVFALDTAKISCMNSKSSVALLWNYHITEDISREELEDKWDNEEASAFNAAKSGEIDDIIDSSEIRQRLTSAVKMLAGKALCQPKRRHTNMPL